MKKEEGRKEKSDGRRMDKNGTREKDDGRKDDRGGDERKEESKGTKQRERKLKRQKDLR